MSKIWLSQADCADAEVILSEILMPPIQRGHITKLSGREEVPNDCDPHGYVVDLRCYIDIQILELFAHLCVLGSS